MTLKENNDNIPHMVTGPIRKEWMPDDWSGGFFNGRYYPPGLEQAEFLQQLLMYGFVVPDQPMGDIPAGQIYGLGYDPIKGPDDPNDWKLGLLDVGLEVMLKQRPPRQPRHQ